MIPRILTDMALRLSNANLELMSDEDARVNSAISRNPIIDNLRDIVQDGWSVITPNRRNNRHWYDFVCANRNTNERFYCNIKISALESNSFDNLNAKKAIYWLLTGDGDSDAQSSRTDSFFEAMRENESLEDRDYYYLVVNKDDIGDVFVVSLRNIASNGIIINPSNPPIQANWNNCRNEELRSMEQARGFFLEKWADVITRQILILDGGMPRSYPEHFRNRYRLRIISASIDS